MPSQVSLQPTAEHVAELRFAASKMHGAERRAFVAEIALKYCNGNARQAEQVFGWGREMVETGHTDQRPDHKVEEESDQHGQAQDRAQQDFVADVFHGW